jgi:hypothetical protein
MAIAFGCSIANWGTKSTDGVPDYGKALVKLGLANTAMAVLNTWVAGFVQGFGYAFFAREFQWPTPEMTGRGEPMNLLAGIVVATASGFVVGLGVTEGGINALVGVAISASLLPPIVNCGICCAFAIIGPSLYDCLGAAKFGDRTRLSPQLIGAQQ